MIELKVTVYGASDDLIEVDGAICEEFNSWENDEGTFLAFNDGTVLKATYDGQWRFNRVEEGAAEYSKEEATGDDGRREDRPDIPAYSDVVTLTIPIDLTQSYSWVEGLKWRWVVCGKGYAKATT